MKFINYLSTITSIEIFPMISLTIFFLFFIGLLFYVFIQDKKVMTAYSELPIDTIQQSIQHEK